MFTVDSKLEYLDKIRVAQLKTRLKSSNFSIVEKACEEWQTWIYDYNSLCEDASFLTNDFFPVEIETSRKTIDHLKATYFNQYEYGHYISLWMIGMLLGFEEHAEIKPEIKSVNLEGTLIPKLPQNIKNFNPIYLGVRNCNLTEIPKSVKHLSNLKTLFLDRNVLSDLPFEVEELSNLLTLNMGNNLFQVFPHCILSLKKLEVLNLNHNPIKVIPSVISQLSNLKQLHLANTDITKIPESLLDLNLTHITLPNDLRKDPIIKKLKGGFFSTRGCNVSFSLN